MSSYMQKFMKSSVTTNRFWIAHTEQEVDTIVYFVQIRPAFPGPVTYIK